MIWKVNRNNEPQRLIEWVSRKSNMKQRIETTGKCRSTKTTKVYNRVDGTIVNNSMKISEVKFALKKQVIAHIPQFESQREPLQLKNNPIALQDEIIEDVCRSKAAHKQKEYTSIEKW